METILIVDLFGTLISLPKNEQDMSPFIRNQLLTKKYPVISRHIEKSLINQKNRAALFEDTYQFLEESSQKHTLICLSNLSYYFVKCFYELKFDQYFNSTMFSCEIGLYKPQPVVYLRILRKYPATKIYMIGDSYHNDYLIPRELGIESYWLNRDGTERNIDSKHQISGLLELSNKIKK